MAELRREPASRRRVREARRGGDVVQSPLLAAGVAVLGLGVWVALAGPAGAERMLELARRSLSAEAVPAEDLSLWLDAAGATAVEVMLPALLVLGVVGAVIGLLQVGPLFAPGLLRPRAERLGPGAAWRAWRVAERWVAMVMTAVAAVALLAVIAWVGRGALPIAARMPQAGLERSLAATVAIGRQLLAGTAAALLLLGVLDLLWRRRVRSGRLRMTRTEVLDELRQTEGGPERRGRERRLRQELAGPDLATAVAAAVVVVTGNRGEAAALAWDAAGEEAPRLLVWAAGAAGERMLALATSSGVAVRAAPGLSAELQRVKPGQVLPMRLWPEAAEVLRANVARATSR